LQALTSSHKESALPFLGCGHSHGSSPYVTTLHDRSGKMFYKRGDVYGYKCTCRRFLRRHGWPFACALILLVAAVARFYKLELKPLHNDEGVNAYFFLRLFKESFYRYDPANYHGPTLYYFALIVSSVSALFFGEGSISIFVLRSVPALFGLGTIYLTFWFRKFLGESATLAASTLLAVSPAAVYFSRDFIHESILVFLTLALVISTLKLYENPTWAATLLLSTLAALLFATKETAGISIAVLCLAGAATLFWCVRAVPRKSAEVVGRLLERFGGRARATILLLSGTMVFVALSFVFYSSFLDNFHGGLHDALKSLELWTRTGTTAHRHGIFTYFLWLGKEEWPLLMLGAAGTLIAGIRRKDVPLFCGLWAFGLMAVYSLIPYKTPWLSLNFLPPLALASGYAVAELYRTLRSRTTLASWSWVILLSAATAVSSFKMWQLNFYRYDDDRNPYVYAQTRRGFLTMMEDINAIAQRNGTGLQTSIAVMSPDYWPLPWYLRDYAKTGYFGHLNAERTDIVITSAVQAKDFLSADYKRYGEYPLRPGVNLVAFVRTTDRATN
jgi:uncharacterized protein (TIGR03663 family)